MLDYVFFTGKNQILARNENETAFILSDQSTHKCFKQSNVFIVVNLDIFNDSNTNVIRGTLELNNHFDVISVSSDYLILSPLKYLQVEISMTYSCT